ncbi:right-handed parallel beta-helix repeat-containing protein [Paenibacillus sp. IB182496]|uniref:Right-handed parallel beta-helix repeat-containing protein n=1 Tax=Paenibacillus sabuli TaxID=2772509 RepID=A0A927BV59_9BACL|nr:right-handed parallel beta-helix repeat-containing protein [Paenibacillus sabuli]MBD2847422.1 right-handed parallel beta-helix repeat-containing protein [Paenibacillus sabuli]
MKRFRLIPLLLAAAVAAPVLPAGLNARTAAADPPGAVLYVAPDGDDSGSGTIGDPLATLDGARDAIRALKTGSGLPAGGVRVELREGAYSLDESFALAAQDSGASGSPIVYGAYDDEAVSLIGGIELDPGDFAAVSDPAIAARLPDGGAQVLELDLAALGVTDYGSIERYGFGIPTVPPPPELFVDDAPQTIARWPNSGYELIGTVDDPGSNPRVGETPDRGAIFEYLDERPENWADLSDVWMYGYWAIDWADGNLRIATLDAATNRIETAQPSHYTVKSGQRYYYYNVLEELDRAGEWYLDRTSGVLYLQPPTGFASSAVRLSLLDDPLITMQDVSHVTFEGLTIEAGRGSGIEMNGGADNIITGSTFRNLGGFAVKIDGGQRHSFAANRVYNTGVGGVSLKGGDRITLTPGEHEVIDSEFSNYSRLKATYSPAVDIVGVGNRVAHNEMYDAPHMAIRLKGNDHIVEYNDIHDVLLETSDAGAIYMGRDWSEQGNVIRYNYLHDLQGYAQGVGQIGIYLDDMASGTTVYGNIIQNSDRGMLIGGGRSNLIVNNMMLDSNRSMTLDARGLGGWSDTCQAGGVMVTRLEAMPYQDEPWASRYPQLTTTLSDSPCSPLYNTVANNVVYNTQELSINSAAAAGGTIGPNWRTTSDPGFVDLANGDLSLAPSAQVLSELPDFEPIPFGMIGIGTPAQRLANLEHELDVHEASGAVRDPLAGLLATAVQQMASELADGDEAGVLSELDSFDQHLTQSNMQSHIDAAAKAALTRYADALRGKLADDPLARLLLFAPTTHTTPGESLRLWAAGETRSGRYAGLYDSLQYSSSDPAVATIDANGAVTTVGTGDAVLTASGELGGVQRQASATLYVANAFLASIELGPAAPQPIVGSTVQLSVYGELADGSPADLSAAQITYGTLDASIATVDSTGLLTALSEGVAGLTASVTLDGVTASTVKYVIVRPDGVSAPPAPWDVYQYGNADGFVAADGAEWSMVSNGADIWGMADSFTYAAQTIANVQPAETLELTFTAESLIDTHKDASVGLMFRDTDAAGAQHVNFRVLPGGKTRFVYRTSEDGASSYASGPTLSYPAELKLTKQGDLFTAYVRQDGQWQQAAQVEVDMDNSELLGGLSLFSHSSEATGAVLTQPVLVRQ